MNHSSNYATFNNAGNALIIPAAVDLRQQTSPSAPNKVVKLLEQERVAEDGHKDRKKP